MIQFFRVYELQRLLLSLNKNHQGKKIDLQKRVIDALNTNYHTIAPQIREIYKSCSPDSQVTDIDLGNRNLIGGPPPYKRMYQSQLTMPVQQHTTGMVANNIVVPFTNNMPTGYPIHPDVRFKKLAFYDILATLIQPSTLVPQNAQRLQETAFYFTLTPQQATEIASNRDIRGGSKTDYTIQVQLRFCLLETSCEQEDCFPPNVIVKVNSKICQLPNPIPTNRPNVEAKRPPRPVNVTVHVKLSPTVTNNITVQWCPDFTRGYVLSAFLVKKLTSSQLLQRMKTRGVKPADYTRALIKEKLTEDADCEIATTMLKVSLICPLGKMKMSIPCRASTCSHLQCFDASLFLQMNERKPTWNCPVCDKPAVYGTLVIDGYFQDVLASPLVTSDDTEIQLHKDGSWSTHIMRNDTQVLDTPNKSVQKVEVISDDLEVITTEPEVKPTATKAITQLPAGITVTTSNEPTSTTSSDTVDLTLSDSDDDLPLKRKTAPSAPNNKTTTNNNPTNGQSKPVASAKTKNEDINLCSSIISLDSPSPPSSPVNLISNSGSTGSSVSSTTLPFCPLPANPLDDGLNPSNFGINPFADQNLTSAFNTINRLYNATNPTLNQHSNVQQVHPYRKEDDWSKN